MKLIKIKLINWHIFTNNTISITGNTLITGENASGKSTLLDAIYYVLSAGDQNHFNKAANESGKRTLDTYVRGKLGSEQKQFLREENDVVSYIVLEFEDVKTHFHQLIGTEIEVRSSDRTRTHFFVINNYSIIDEDYIVDKKVVDFRQFKNNFKAKNIEVDELNGSKDDIKRKICRDIFKLKDYRRFFELLQNAICFKPIGEVSSFVNGFLLQKEDIDLTSLREEIRSYQEIHKLIIKEQEKINCLSDFTPKAETYLSNFEGIQYLKALKIQSQIEKNRNQMNKILIDSKRKEEEKKSIDSKTSALNEQKVNLIKEISQLENNEVYQALREKEELKKRKMSEQEKMREILAQFEAMIRKEASICRMLSLNYRFNEDFKSKDFGLIKAHLENYKIEINQMRKEEIEKRAKNDVINSENKKIKQRKFEELLELKRGINNYPIDVKKLIEIAKDEIRRKNPNEKNPDVRPFCEHIEILDEKWTNALEGYLNTQRFNIIVEPKYYDIVADAYDKYKHTRKVYGVGLVNTSSIPRKEGLPDSMMSKIVVVNENANKYANYLLGNLICVEKAINLKNYECSITPEVMIYKNYVLRACKPEVYKIPFIGQNSLEKRISLLDEEINGIEKQISETDNLISISANIISTIESSQVDRALEIENVWVKIELLDLEINRLTQEIEEDKKNQGLLEISNKLQKTKEKNEVISNELREFAKKCTELDRQIGSIYEKISSLRLEGNSLESDLKAKKNSLDLEKYRDKESTYRNNKMLDENRIVENLESAQNQNNAIKDKLISTMQEYSKSYKPSLTPLIENLQDFINEYYALINRGIVRYEREAQEAYNRAASSFKEDFISKLREKINKSQKMLNDINKNLALHPFGNDEEKYKFYYEPTKDSEFYNYYRIIMSNRMFESNDLFTETLDPKDASFMKDLFNKISMETNSEKAEAELQRYLDYRNYMSYDIKITNKYGRDSYFSKISKEKSGGETQTPFYIVIASCFDELMNKDSNKDSTCLVAFDEAFNNMDEGRIQSLMEFYKQLNIQIIIIVPSNRMSSISPYMDTLLGVVKIKDKPYVVKTEKNI